MQEEMPEEHSAPAKGGSSVPGRAGFACPECGGPTRRVHRSRLERVFSVLYPVRKYRCQDWRCGWEGVVPLHAQRAGGTSRKGWLGWADPRFRITAAASLAVLAVLAVVLARQHFATPTADLVSGLPPETAPPLPVGPGESYYGEPLPADHPLLARAAAPVPMPNAAAPEPLTLRRNCGWGKPGANPYRGDVVQALTAAGLPEHVVRRIDAMVQQGLVTDRVEISNEGIRSVNLGLQFSAKRVGMTFGTTLCLDTQVNFEPGHVERADLFQVSDPSGQTYSVMVPYVCGNVSVLAARAEQGGPESGGESGTLDGPNSRSRNGPGGGGGGGGDDVAAVPEPGTLTMMGIGALVAAAMHRRRTAAARSAASGVRRRRG